MLINYFFKKLFKLLIEFNLLINKIQNIEMILDIIKFLKIKNKNIIINYWLSNFRYILYNCDIIVIRYILYNCNCFM